MGSKYRHKMTKTYPKKELNDFFLDSTKRQKKKKRKKEKRKKW